MNGKALLDSNAVVQILNGKLDLPRLGFDEILVPMTVVGELFFGVHKSARVTENRRRLLTFLDLVSLVSSDLEVAEMYGQIKATLRSKGKPIPENDMWIAATAIRHRLPLVTNDKHFGEVERLAVIRWS
ncbi:MAG: type II toxin-antitoxin system VapC family toxin [Bacteroidota bacterium]|nr:type II toxin-antitoxin system VapC family toxin [Bacteroidota bacterium]MDP4231775.1 type II toxin-antitoxin system VapC family toxin [Bacteroidota bacterium]MDP4243511.1 type II toxin-antitoxin system VapC family toxin [Bacteroidota bacterium]